LFTATVALLQSPPTELTELVLADDDDWPVVLEPVVAAVVVAGKAELDVDAVDVAAADVADGVTLAWGDFEPPPQPAINSARTRMAGANKARFSDIVDLRPGPPVGNSERRIPAAGVAT
jgi:hypothetical protein